MKLFGVEFFFLFLSVCMYVQVCRCVHICLCVQVCVCGEGIIPQAPVIFDLIQSGSEKVVLHNDLTSQKKASSMHFQPNVRHWNLIF